MMNETKEIIRSLYATHGNYKDTLAAIYDAGRMRLNDSILCRPGELVDRIGQEIGKELISCTSEQLINVVEE